MLTSRPEEQNTLFREIMIKRLTVRDSEHIARRIAVDRVRKKDYFYSPDVVAMEKELTEALGTRVAIEHKENGGKLSIDFFGEDDLRSLFNVLEKVLNERESNKENPVAASDAATDGELSSEMLDDRTREEKEVDENEFDPSSFSI